MSYWLPALLILAALFCANSYRHAARQLPDEIPQAALAPPSTGSTPDNHSVSIRAADTEKPGHRFGGYSCIGDCSEDKAGYKWAQQHGITDPDSCTGNTGSFIDGCRVYALQRAKAGLDN